MKRKTTETESNELSDYGKFHLQYLGFNFRNKHSGEIITKGKYFLLFGNAWHPEWELIPYEPEAGWNSEEARTEHFKFVDENFKYYRDDIHRPLIKKTINF